MICKWCGAQLQDGAVRCRRCGKEASVKSDCGGFYDIIPGAGRQPDDPQNPRMYVPMTNQDMGFHRVEKEAGRKGAGQKLPVATLIVTCLGMIVSIVLLLALNSQIGTLFAQLEMDGGQLDSIAQNLEQLQTKMTVETEETLPVVVPVEKQNVEITLAVDNNGINTAVQTMAKLDGVDDSMREYVVLDNETGALTAARIDVNGKHECILLTLSEDMKEVEIPEEPTEPADPEEPTEPADPEEPAEPADSEEPAEPGDPAEPTESAKPEVYQKPSDVDAPEEPMKQQKVYEGCVSVEIEVEEIVFGVADKEAEYLWSFRTNDAGEWLPLNEMVFKVSPDGKTITYYAEELEKTYGEAAGNIELRLEYRRDSNPGGSVRMEVSGIKLTRKTPAVEVLDLDNEE